MAEPLAGHSELVKQLFDAKAPSWSAKYASDGRLTSRLALLAAALRYHLPAGGRILDLGCGTGELARTAANEGMRVTACDISPEMLRRAVASDAGSGVEWIRLDLGWRMLPFEPAAFDAVVAASVLEYVDAPSTVFGECVRVLRPNGVMLCTVPNLAHPIRWLELPAAAVARSPLARITSRRWRSLEDYMTYLRISRQRHSTVWWRAVAAQSGLRPVPCGTDSGGHSPLSLLSLWRADGAKGDSWLR